MPDRHIGFTGTREGMSEHQKETLSRILTAFLVQGSVQDDVIVFHHGDCKGADAEAHEIVCQLREIMKDVPTPRIIIHPPVKRIMRAYCQGADEILPPKDYLERDRAIVDSCIGIFAAPKTDKEERRSGTWYTVRYARKTNKRVVVLARE
jgi:hypothetical protein